METWNFLHTAEVGGDGRVLEAGGLELHALVLLRQRQGGRYRVRSDLPAKPLLAEALQPVQPIPIRRGQQVLQQHRLPPLGELIRVHVLKHSLEDARVHVLHGHTGGLGVSDEAEELRAEDGRPGREYQLMGFQGLFSNFEDHVGAEPRVQKFPQALAHVGRRDGHAELPWRLHAGSHHAHGAAHRETIVLNEVRRLQGRPPEESLVSPDREKKGELHFCIGKRRNVKRTTCYPCT